MLFGQYFHYSPAVLCLRSGCKAVAHRQAHLTPALSNLKLTTHLHSMNMKPWMQSGGTKLCEISHPPSITTVDSQWRAGFSIPQSTFTTFSHGAGQDLQFKPKDLISLYMSLFHYWCLHIVASGDVQGFQFIWNVLGGLYKIVLKAC